MKLSRGQFSDPWVSRGQASLLLVLILLISLCIGVLFGQWTSFMGYGLKAADAPTEPEIYAVSDVAAVRDDVRKRQEIDRLTMQLEVANSRSEVDRRAVELLRREIATQKEQIANLEEGVRFYRSLMAPGEIAQGLSLRELELVLRDDGARYGYRIVVQQEARKHNLVKGDLSIEIFGIQDGQPVKYPLAELSQDVDEQRQALRFRYFQSIEGELMLPEGFEPEGVEIVARFTAPRSLELNDRFDWQLKESFTHVGT